MQHSKSLGSFNSGSTAPHPGQRPRARSSLDTFVIPGRTRIPSSKPQTIDVQIAETLLNTTMVLPVRGSSADLSSYGPRKDSEEKRLLVALGIRDTKSPGLNQQHPALESVGGSLGAVSSFEQGEDSEEKRLLDALGIKDTKSRTSSEQHHAPNGEHQRSQMSSQNNEPDSIYALRTQARSLHKLGSAISKRLPPQIGGRDVIIVPPQRPRKVVGNAPPKRLAPTPPRRTAPGRELRSGVYDGAIGSSYESRTTSMTWSTVSQRIFTDSSASSQGLEASESLGEFNQLAVQHGLQALEKCPGDDHKKTEKVHHHNWLTRKLFPRSSSTYSLKIKSTQKSLKHKKSFGMIPKLEDPSQKNILKDKSLEEFCRLGGMGGLVLPHGFSATKQFSLPTCLSATATYLLQHGINNPGLFRISGQSSTINTLYEYYAFQFAQAGSPSKVQETVGSGLLPTHIEYTVPDVASLFKKILNALPGGLLGSIELFEALRSIFFRLSPSPALSDSDTKTLQAKLVALAISSVTSTKRVSLIQAIIGLVAYFGDEAEQARKAAAASNSDAAKEIQPPSELMGYQSLGVVMGPLMLGNLIDQLDPTPVPYIEDPSRKSIDSVKKADKRAEKKQKCTSVTNKLDRDATLSTHVDRANLTANVMELLLIVWKDVVVQLREIQGEGSSTSFEDINKQLRKTKSGAGSRQYLTSDEETLIVNMMRGRPPPADFSGEFKMKRKIKVERSPMGRRSRKASSDAPESPAKFACSGELRVKIDRPSSVGPHTTEDTVRIVDRSESSTAGSPDSNTRERGSFQEDQRTNSEIAMAQMSMGTILPRLQDSPVTPLHNEMLRPISPPQTPKIDSSSSATPETALRDPTNPDADAQKEVNRSNSSLDKPLPPIGAAQRAEISPRESEEEYYSKDTDHGFPERKSSLLQDKAKQEQLSVRPLQLTEPLFEPGPSMILRSRSFATPNSRKVSQAEINQSTDGGSKFPQRSKRGSVKLLAQRFDDAPNFNIRTGSMDSSIPKVYANVYALPLPNTARHDDPFLSSTDTSPERTTRIPKPAQGVGSVRKAYSCSPSPPKSPKPSSSPPKRLTPKQYLRKRPSVFNIVPDNGADMVETNSVRSSEASETVVVPTPAEGECNPTSRADVERVASQLTELKHKQDALDEIIGPQPSRSPPPPPQRTSSIMSHSRTDSSDYLEVAPTRPLSAYSEESVRRIYLAEEPPVAHHIPLRLVSMDSNTNESSKGTDTTCQSESNGLKRSGSVNTAMAAEIRSLKRIIEKKGKDLRETRRSLDALRGAREDTFTAGGGKASGSVSKGTLANELRLSRKETAEWKRRAEWAESRLTVIEEKRKAEARSSMRVSQVGSPRRGSSGNGRPKEWLHE